ncbi:MULTISPECIES: ABC transporter permease [Arthrobacter]|uniref:ABC transporter permease n=1 Tax=Arthrobacter terricola TaxID=2547396 RepID=A0A4R5KCR3_9MICC|nr:MULTISPECIES: ABC transporter permease [Arthrobacter]MBT8161802.1 ABC transporter permease [Arthrobacter sp. GN70]TDF92642.1 ABC transporter permease [Arthrobacter terricola]
MANNSPARQTAVFLVRKAVSSVITLIGLSMFVFLMVKLIPGDEARVAAGENATPAQVEAVRKSLGLDQPFFVQLLQFFGRLLHGDLGTSITTHQSVLQGIEQVMPQTIELVVLAIIIIISVVTPLATLSALRRDGATDVAIKLFVILSAAMPTFWLALLLQYLLGTQIGIVPISGRLSRQFNIPTQTGAVVVDSLLAGNPLAAWDGLQHLIVPAIVLALPFGAQLYRILRAELIQVLSREHLTVARAKGVPQRQLVWRHVLPNSIGPGITLVGIQFGAMTGAAVLVEGVFGLVGVGSYLTNAVAQKDTFAVLGGVLVIGVLVVVSNYVVDVLQLIRDPRLRAGQLG